MNNVINDENFPAIAYIPFCSSPRIFEIATLLYAVKNQNAIEFRHNGIEKIIKRLNKSKSNALKEINLSKRIPIPSTIALNKNPMQEEMNIAE